MEEVPKEEVRLLKICVDQCTENSAATLMPIFEDDGCEIYYLEKFWFKINKKRLSDDVAIRKESSPFYGVHDQIEVVVEFLISIYYYYYYDFKLVCFMIFFFKFNSVYRKYKL